MPEEEEEAAEEGGEMHHVIDELEPTSRLVLAEESRWGAEAGAERPMEATAAAEDDDDLVPRLENMQHASPGGEDSGGGEEEEEVQEHQREPSDYADTQPRPPPAVWPRVAARTVRTSASNFGEFYANMRMTHGLPEPGATAAAAAPAEPREMGVDDMF
jgi:hypothetical protein